MTTITTRASTYMDTLDAGQRAAATSPARRLFVSATAGAGKTRTLVARVVHLLEERGLPSHAVLACCFTRAAAAEVRRRVTEIVGEEMARLLRCSTLHAFCLSLLRSVQSRGLLPGEFQVASEEEYAETLSGIFVGPEARPEARKTSLRRVTDELRVIDSTGEGSPDADPATRHVVSMFHARLVLRGLATHGQVMGEVWRLLSEDDPETLLAVEGIAHVLVDEVQDCSPLELKIVRALRAEETYAGDPRQAVMGWRGGNGLGLVTDDPSIERVDLPRSYRFGPVIASHANTILPPGQYGPPVEGSGDLAGVILRTPRASLVPLVTDAVARHGRLGVAVLARTNWEAAAAATELGPDLATHVTRRDPVALRAALAIARLSLRSGDEAAFRLLWRLDGGAATDLHGLMARSGHARSMYAQWMRESHLTAGLLAEATKLPGNAATWRDCMNPCVNLDGALDLWRASEGLEDKPVAEAVDALTERAERDDFRRAREQGKVPCATVHAAKGLEWPAVAVLTGARWPPAEQRDEREHEEARVAFVALTRAKTELVVLDDGGFRS